MVVVCIALLEALDYLQERLNLPLKIVQKLKTQLRELLDDRILSTTEHGSSEVTKHLARRIAESEAWARATTEDLIGFVSWIGSGIYTYECTHFLTIKVVWWWFNRVAISSALGIASQALVLVTYIPGVPQGQALFYTIYDVLEKIVLQSQELGGATPGSAACYGSTAVSSPVDVAATYASAPWITDETTNCKCFSINKPK